MNVQEKYSPEEWNLIARTPLLVGAVMSGVAPSGMMGMVKEAVASSQEMLKGGEGHPDNPIVQALTMKPDSFGDAKDAASKQKELIMERIKGADVQNPEQLQQVVLADCQEAVCLLEGKEEEATIQGYKNWLLEIADKVANAAKEGGFLGFGGTRYSEEEKAFYDTLSNTLNNQTIV